MKKKKKNLMFLPDTHAPAHDRDALLWAAGVRDAYEIDEVIQLGDLGDLRGWNRFPKNPADENPSLEWEQTEAAVHEIHSIFPELTLIIGNHDTRILKKAFEVGIPRKLIRSLEDVFDFEGWKWHLGPQPLIRGNTAIIHGDEMSGHIGLKASRLGMNLVQGHSHQGRLEFVSVLGKLIYGMECGCLVNVSASNFDYAAKNPRGVWRGVGLEIDGDPFLLTYPG